MGLRRSALAILAATALTSSAAAAPVSIYFTGTFQSIDPEHFFALSQQGVGLGSLVTGVIVIDDSAADQLPADPTRAIYQTPLLSISIASGSWSGSWTVIPGTELHVNIAVVNQNQPSPNADGWRATGSVSGHILNPLPAFSGYELFLGDSALGANIVSDSLVPPGGVDDWQQSTLDIGFLPNGQLLSRIALTSVVVPEPSAVLLVGVMAAMIAARRSIPRSDGG